jgi:hypothetical protein
VSDWVAPLGAAALHAPAGEFVEPHTEADPAALLAQLLVAFGVAAGRHSYLTVEASRHYPNEFVVLVGASRKGRKGSSWDHLQSLLARIDPSLTDDRVASGLSSGEGLIAEVCDSQQDTGAPKDKRLLVLEPEFAQVIKVLAREGNTLSPVIRNAWDGKRLQTLVRNSPLRASDAHIAIVGHITKDDPPGADLRAARRCRGDRPATPRSRTRGLALRPQQHPLGTRRPHRRRDLGAGQATPRWDQPHRSPRPVQPQQESPRDRPRAHGPRRRRTPGPPTTARWGRATRRDLDPHPRGRLTSSPHQSGSGWLQPSS